MGVGFGVWGLCSDFLESTSCLGGGVSDHFGLSASCIPRPRVSTLSHESCRDTPPPPRVPPPWCCSWGRVWGNWDWKCSALKGSGLDPIAFRVEGLKGSGLDPIATFRIGLNPLATFRVGGFRVGTCGSRLLLLLRPPLAARPPLCGAGFRVWGKGFTVEGLGFKVFRV